MKYYKLQPEVPGQLGNKTKMDTSVHPPKIDYLHFVFDGWQEDELIECFPVFLVTEELLKDLEKARLTGFKAKPVEITYSDVFMALYPNKIMPRFIWLEVDRNATDDFIVNNENFLIVSEKAMELLTKRDSLKHCDIEELPSNS